MDIAALSMGMKQVQLQQSMGIALTKKFMDMAQAQQNDLINMIDASTPAPHPTSGKAIDVSI